MRESAPVISMCYGRLIPDDLAGEAQMVHWCFAAMTTVEAPLQSLMVHDWTAEGAGGGIRCAAQQESG